MNLARADFLTSLGGKTERKIAGPISDGAYTVFAASANLRIGQAKKAPEAEVKKQIETRGNMLATRFVRYMIEQESAREKFRMRKFSAGR